MIKRIASFISAIVLCILILPLELPEANAEMLTGYPRESALIDEAGIYENDTATFEELDSLIKAKADELGMNLIVFLAGTKRSDDATIVFADDSYDEIFGENTNGIFYYMDTSGGYGLYDVLSTSGTAVFNYGKHKYDILDAVAAYLPASGEPVYESNITYAVKYYLDVLDRYKNDKTGFFDYDYDNNSDTYAYYQNGKYTVSKHKPWFMYLENFLHSIGIGTIIAVIIYFVNKRAYTFKVSADPKIYVANKQTVFRIKNDIFLRTDTSRSRISSSSSSSRSHSSHHSSSHHSHSGHHSSGGRHR